MTRIRMFTVIAALAAASVASADSPKTTAQADKKADKPAARPDDKAGKKETLAQATADRFVAFFDKLVELVVASKEDCAKMAASINGHIDANQALLKEVADAKAQNKEPPQSMKDHVMQKTRDELQPAMAKCGQDPAVMNAFTRIRGARAK